jgi:hypothetical protein
MLIDAMTKDELVAEVRRIKALYETVVAECRVRKEENALLRAQNAKLENDLFYSVELE